LASLFDGCQGQKGCAMKALHSAVREFLASDPKQLFIGGEWVNAADGATLEARDPGDGSVIAHLASGGAPDVDRAVSAARQAFRKSGWATMPVNDRAVVLHRLADLVDKHRDILAQIESLDVGKPLSQAAGNDIPNVAQTLRYYADLAVHTRRAEPIAVSGYDARSIRVPYGVCAFIIPWNFPALLVGWGISPALAAGNTVVVKPPEDASLSTLYLCRLAQEAGVPPGVINVVTGYGETAGAALAQHPGINRMSFTGSPEVGRLVAESCGRNLVPVKLELGGKGAAVLFGDVDVESAAQSLAGAITLNSGQVCCTATRWIVHDSIRDEFVDAARAALSATRIGHGLDPDSQMGPVISEKQRSRVLGYLERGEREGADVLLRGGVSEVAGCEGGYYVKPALLGGAKENVCAQDEIFGPTAYVMGFSDEDEAVALVNRSSYGLANSVWSADLGRANRVAEAMVAGNSWINAHNIFAHGIPYAGCNLSGMGGGVLGPDTLFDYLRPQSIVRPL
jgi:acyl-CoA reductase-like NAD-dependent aldehyde dehydrogenase